MGSAAAAAAAAAAAPLGVEGAKGVGLMGGERSDSGGSKILVGEARPPPPGLLPLPPPPPPLPSLLLLLLLWLSEERYASCAAVRTAAGARCA